jgi:hypothetical protein
MFDRGLISIANDHSILLSRHVNDAVGVQADEPYGRMLPPARAVDQSTSPILISRGGIARTASRYEGGMTLD